MITQLLPSCRGDMKRWTGTFIKIKSNHQHNGTPDIRMDGNHESTFIESEGFVLSRFQRLHMYASIILRDSKEPRQPVLHCLFHEYNATYKCRTNQKCTSDSTTNMCKASREMRR